MIITTLAKNDVTTNTAFDWFVVAFFVWWKDSLARATKKFV